MVYIQGYHRSRTKNKADENLILLPKKKTIICACTTNVRSCLPTISRNHLLQQCLILDFLLVIVTENFFSLANFLNQFRGAARICLRGGGG